MVFSGVRLPEYCFGVLLHGDDIPIASLSFTKLIIFFSVSSSSLLLFIYIYIKLCFFLAFFSLILWVFFHFSSVSLS